MSSQLSNSTCQGDSGGPVYWQRGANDWVQVGITSFGPTSCGTGAITSVFTEIYDYRTWIDSVIAGSETASYTATDARREEYLASLVDTGNTDSSSNSGDSGGSLPLWVLAGLGLFFSRRR
ncbi:trypsin-like serine protease [Vibrio mexicanus]|uniref:trypsin-like serine protease n=1 Tax=Vibrio mexicanus TaxID=1004326 RepID=UPI00138E3A2B|nr:trypsin-like serine protease [Vibrio mexicanus]